jgi:hypothetical protein
MYDDLTRTLVEDRQRELRQEAEQQRLAKAAAERPERDGGRPEPHARPGHAAA